MDNKQSIKSFFLEDEKDTVMFGRFIRENCPLGTTIYMDGNLGAGKTTFTRGFVQASGYDGIVKSPTYTLVETYNIQDYFIYHFDLYRLNDPEELEMMGIRDYFQDNSIRIIEWPDKGEGYLSAPDIIISIIYDGKGRTASIKACTGKGKLVFDELISKDFKI